LRNMIIKGIRESVSPFQNIVTKPLLYNEGRMKDLPTFFTG
jgi:hypothetical protein